MTNEKPIIDEHILYTMPIEDRKFVLELRTKIEGDRASLDKICAFVREKMATDGTVDFENIQDDDLKAQACAEYIVIGLLSGKFMKVDIGNALKV